MRRSSFKRVLVPLTAGFVILGGMRGVALWGERSSDSVPSWIASILPNPAPSQNSDLKFDKLSFVFEALLEGDIINTTFPFHNDSDTPIRIKKARHCGCLQIEVPRDRPIEPGEHATLHARLDSANRGGPLVKPIELFTDEEGKGPHATVLVKGNVHSPAIFRRPRVAWTKAFPGETKSFSLPYSLQDGGEHPQVKADGDFFTAELQEDGREGELVIVVTAPEKAGAREGSVSFSCDLTAGDWSTEEWTKKIPVRVVVQELIRAITRRVILDESGESQLMISLPWPDEFFIERVEIPGEVATATREEGNNPRLAKYTIRRESTTSSLPDDCEILVFTNLDDGVEPTLRISLTEKR